MKDISKKFLITKEEAFCRADLFLIQKKIIASRSEASKLFHDQKVKIGGKTIKASYRLKESELLSVTHPEKPEKTILKAHLKPHLIPLEILFEDEELLILNKPAGLVVHPGAGHKDKTLVNVLLAHGKKLSPGSEPLRPGIVASSGQRNQWLAFDCKNKRI